MKQSFSILLSFFLLVSHMYLTIGTHFCGGEAVERKILFGETHLGCNMPGMDDPCNIPIDNNDERFNKVPCCQNKYQTFQVTDDFVKDAAQISINLDFALAFIYTTLNFDLFPKTSQQSFITYISPPLEKDIQVLFQTFLI